MAAGPSSPDFGINERQRWSPLISPPPPNSQSFEIPKEIVKGVIKIKNATKSYLRKNQGRFMSSAVAALGLKTSRFKILRLRRNGEAEEKEGTGEEEEEGEGEGEGEEEEEEGEEEQTPGSGLGPVRHAGAGIEEEITMSYAVEVVRDKGEAGMAVLSGDPSEIFPPHPTTLSPRRPSPL